MAGSRRKSISAGSRIHEFDVSLGIVRFSASSAKWNSCPVLASSDQSVRHFPGASGDMGTFTGCIIRGDGLLPLD